MAFKFPGLLAQDNKHALVSTLKSFANSGNILQGMHVHALITEQYLPLHPFLGNTLLSMYAKCGLPLDASKVLAMMPEKTDVSWTVIITCLAKHGHPDQASALYKKMVLQGFMPNAVIFVCVLNICTSQMMMRDGRIIHAAVIEHGFDLDIFVASALVNMYAKLAYFEDAHQLFNASLDRNVVTWTSMIAGYADYGFSEEAFTRFVCMQHEGLIPDQVTLVSILKACTLLEDLNRGKQYHVMAISAGSKQTVSLNNALIHMYAKCGRLDTSREIFQRMEKRDVVSWSIIIAGCVENVLPTTALEYYERMQNETVEPNHVTLTSVLKACASLALLKEGQWIQNRMIADGIIVEPHLESALIEMYTKCGQVGDAYQVFHRSTKKDVVLWTAMISGYAYQALNTEALELFERMLISGIKANAVTFVSVLCASSGLAAIKHGMHIHEQICRSGLSANADLCAALINMYSKCGLLEDARRVFDMLPVCSIIPWTIMVTAYSEHGHGKQALELACEMQERNMKLDHASFVSVIAACNNDGLVREASNLIDSMCKDYKFVPSTQHYACIAAALGRAGQLKEAEVMLKSMPFQPNAVSWRSFLGALKNHDGLKLVDNIAELVTDFEPQSADDFVLLSNMYCAAAARDEGGETVSEKR